MSTQLRTRLSLFTFILILIFVCHTYYQGVWYRYPYGIHSWAQSDRLALAMGFYDNGMDFFHPRTYCQYSIEGITGVEFPIQSYLAASLGFVFGRNNISACFRFLDTIISCAGLLALYLTVFRATKNFILSLVTPLFIFCAPVFIAYTCGYMPDTASVSVCFISFYFLFDYLKTTSNKSLVMSIALLGLATLIKTSTGIYLIGVTAYGMLEHIKNRKQYTVKEHVGFLTVIFISYVAVIGYYLYNQYLNTKFESTLFLAKPAPFESWETFNKYINGSFKDLWIKEYMVFPQYVILATLLVTTFPFMHREPSMRPHQRLFLVFFAGSLCMFYLVGNQLPVHDYYILAIFFPLLAFGMMSALLYLEKQELQTSGRKMLNTALFTCVLTTFFFADYQTYRRLRTDYRPFSDDDRMYWMKNGKQILKQLQIPDGEKILVINEYSPNLSLCYFDRKGLVYPADYWHNDILFAENAMRTHGISLLVFESKFLNEKRKEDPAFFKDFTILHSDEAAVLRLK